MVFLKFFEILGNKRTYQQNLVQIWYEKFGKFCSIWRYLLKALGFLFLKIEILKSLRSNFRVQSVWWDKLWLENQYQIDIKKVSFYGLCFVRLILSHMSRPSPQPLFAKKGFSGLSFDLKFYYWTPISFNKWKWLFKQCRHCEKIMLVRPS